MKGKLTIQILSSDYFAKFSQNIKGKYRKYIKWTEEGGGGVHVQPSEAQSCAKI